MLSQCYLYHFKPLQPIVIKRLFNQDMVCILTARPPGCITSHSFGRNYFVQSDIHELEIIKNVSASLPNKQLKAFWLHCFVCFALCVLKKWNGIYSVSRWSLKRWGGVLSLQRKMRRYYAVLTSLVSSFHHCGARIEKSLDRDEQPQCPRSVKEVNRPEAEGRNGRAV